MARSIALILALGLAVVACSPTPVEAPVLIFHNRSDVGIALYPGVTVAPCSTLELDEYSIEQGKARLDQAFADFIDWIPAGAVRPGFGIQGQRIGSSEPISVVVSGVAQPRVVEHRISPAELPQCGGQPVGLE